MINWESILPNKVGEERTERYRFAYNMAIEDCLESLKAAETRGEICKPLSVEELKKVVEKVRWEMSARLFQKGLKSEIDVSFEIAEAIHRAMTNKGDVCDR